MADKAVKPIPEGFRSVNPYLCVDGAARAIEFYKEAFGATERFRMEIPGGGKIGTPRFKSATPSSCSPTRCPR